MIQPLTRLALQGLAIFFSLQAEVSFPFFSVHIKKNIINQLQEDKGQFVKDGEVNARRGNAYYKVKLMHCFVFFLVPLVFFFDAFPTAALGCDNGI